MYWVMFGENITHHEPQNSCSDSIFGPKLFKIYWLYVLCTNCYVKIVLIIKSLSGSFYYVGLKCLAMFIFIVGKDVSQSLVPPLLCACFFTQMFLKLTSFTTVKRGDTIQSIRKATLMFCVHST